MKNSAYIIILLALGLVFTSYKWVVSSSQSSVTDDCAKSSTIEDIMSRTSIRSYADFPVGKETVDTLLRAAMAAPTAGNKQPWRFVVIDNKKTLESVGEKFQNMKMARNASLAVVLCGDTLSTFTGEGVGYWIQDVSAATENLLLAAHAVGLGAVWCGIYPISERVEYFSGLLKLPENVIPMACVCIGYPDGQTTPKDKWNPDYVRYNEWN